MPRGFFGINAQYVPLLPDLGLPSALEPHLSSIEDLGVGFVRSNLDWRGVEPLAPIGGERRYDFRSTDVWVGALALHGLRWQVTGVAPAPVWAVAAGADVARCESRALPPRTADFVALIAAVAERYGREGSFWSAHPKLPYRPITEYEVWNEPNFGSFWCPWPEPAAYARLYLASRRAIHTVDPAARVTLGGLAGFATSDPPGPRPYRMSVGDFLARAVAAEPRLRGRVDAVGIHPYAPDPAGVLMSLRRSRAALDDAGLEDSPLSLNEIGWNTRGPGGLPPVPEEVRAGYLAELTRAAPFSGCEVVTFAPHTWITPETDPLNPEHWWGMADPRTGSPYPIAQAYGTQLRALEREANAPPQGMMLPACRGSRQE